MPVKRNSVLARLFCFFATHLGWHLWTAAEVTGFRCMLAYMDVHLYMCPLAPQTVTEKKMNDIYSFVFLMETPLIIHDIYLNIP